MFELLFGQVTTILGELDDSKSATFETRVLEALFAENDAKMGRLLARARDGTRRRAREEPPHSSPRTADSAAGWRPPSNTGRAHKGRDATELAPEVSRNEHGCDNDVSRHGYEVSSSARRAESCTTPVTVTVPSSPCSSTRNSKQNSEGGRCCISRSIDYGLEHHPDAELCAVGSPVFDELLGLLRMRGDLHATVPVVPEDPGNQLHTAHARDTTLVGGASCHPASGVVTPPSARR